LAQPVSRNRKKGKGERGKGKGERGKGKGKRGKGKGKRGKVKGKKIPLPNDYASLFPQQSERE